MMKISWFLLISLCFTLPAHAAWQSASASGTTVWVSVHGYHPSNVFAAGYQPDASNFRLKVSKSGNGGASFTDISGDLDDAAVTVKPSAIFFFDASHGWMAAGSKVYRTTNGGGAWTGVEVTVIPRALYFSSADVGFLMGDGGAIKKTINGGAAWTDVTSPTSVKLVTMFWQDEDHAWAAGYNATGSGDTEDPTSTQVIKTTNGGDTWSNAATISGEGATAIFFLDDRTHGWVATYERIDADHARAHLHATNNGGTSFTDMGLPMKVGTVETPTQSDINTSFIHTMYFTDDGRAHLSGSAYVATHATTDDELWRIVDYTTENDGDTWSKTSLGTIVITAGEDLPQSDGRTRGGQLVGLENGWLASDEGRWHFAFSCNDDDECGPDFACDEDACVLASEAGGDTGGGNTRGGGDGPPPSNQPKAKSCAGTTPEWLAALFALGLARRRRVT